METTLYDLIADVIYEHPTRTVILKNPYIRNILRDNNFVYSLGQQDMQELCQALVSAKLMKENKYQKQWENFLLNQQDKYVCSHFFELSNTSFMVHMEMREFILLSKNNFFVLSKQIGRKINDKQNSFELIHLTIDKIQNIERTKNNIVIRKGTLHCINNDECLYIKSLMSSKLNLHSKQFISLLIKQKE